MKFAANHGTLLLGKSWQPFTRMRLKYGRTAPRGDALSLSFSKVPPLLPRPAGHRYMSSESDSSRLHKMASSSPQHQLWHVSRGIVFARGAAAVYPRLPVAGYHSSPDLLTERDDTVLLAAGGPGLATSSQVLGQATIVRGGDTKGRANSVPPTSADTAQATVLDAASEDALDQQPVTLLDFKIPPEVFREAKSTESFWSYALYRGPGSDGATDAKVKVHYCKSKHTTERVLQEYFMNEKMLGFDIEWAMDAHRRPTARRNVSLVQIASQSRIALFHIALFPKGDDVDDLVAPSLKKIMEDPMVTKAGVCIKGDCTRLSKWLHIDTRGIFELSHLYKLVKYSTTKDYGAIDRRPVNLATQVQECLGLPLFKGQDVRASDWSQAINLQQIEYSASDAYAAVQIYGVLDQQRRQLVPEPPLPLHAELNRPIRLADGVIIPTPDESLEPVGEPVQLNAAPATDLDPAVVGGGEQRPRDTRIVAAGEWAAAFRSGRSVVSAQPGCLRAYHMWHNNADLDPRAIAALLRTPPLQTATVVNYILEAIRLEKLPYDAARLEAEVLAFFPEGALPRRYSHLASRA